MLISTKRPQRNRRWPTSPLTYDIIFWIAGIKRGRYTLEKRTDCILELKRHKSSMAAADALAQTEKKLEDLITTVSTIDAKYPCFSAELIASIPEKVARSKVSPRIFSPTLWCKAATV